MASRRTRQSVPAAETGAVSGDFQGSRGMKLPGGAARQPNLGTSGSGIAPKPSGGANLLGNDRPSHPQNAGLARVKNRPSSSSGPAGPSGSFNPLQNNANTNLRNKSVGQPNPNTAAASTTKPKRKGLGSAFFGEY